MPLRHYTSEQLGTYISNISSEFYDWNLIMQDLNMGYIFEYHTIKIGGRQVVQNRRTLYFGDVDFSYSGSTLKAKEFPTYIKDLMIKLNTLFNVNTNTCLINYYENGKENIGHHSDGRGYRMYSNNTVITVSLGTSRVFEVKNKMNGEVTRLTLNHGDIVIMDGDFQDHNTHALVKDNNIKDWRISLTFRHI